MANASSVATTMATISLPCVASIEVAIDDFALSSMQRAHRGFRCRQTGYHLALDAAKVVDFGLVKDLDAEDALRAVRSSRSAATVEIALLARVFVASLSLQ